MLSCGVVVLTLALLLALGVETGRSDWPAPPDRRTPSKPRSLLCLAGRKLEKTRAASTIIAFLPEASPPIGDVLRRRTSQWAAAQIRTGPPTRHAGAQARKLTTTSQYLARYSHCAHGSTAYTRQDRPATCSTAAEGSVCGLWSRHRALLGFVLVA